MQRAPVIVILITLWGVGAWGDTGQAEAPPSPTAPGAPGEAVLAASATEQGIALFEQRRYAEAKILFGKAVALNPDDAGAQAYLGLVLLNWDADIDGATAHLERAVQLDPSSSRYHRWLGEAYSAQTATVSGFEAPELARKTKAELEKAVEVDGHDLDARLALLQFYLAAPASLGGSDAKGREQALAMTMLDRYRGLLAQGIVAEHEKELSRAEQLYRTAIAGDPGKGDAYNALGYLLLSRKRREEAVVVFHRYVEATPADANAHDSLAEGLLATGKVVESIAEYKKALEIDPRFASSYLGLAKCYEAQGSQREAREALQRFLEIVPNGRQADEARDKLDELAQKPR
jgi:tetratricopeptide (TPR) repeat protein